MNAVQESVCDIVTLDPNRDVDSIVSMHMELLPHSPVVLLGPLFMRKFYYEILPREDLIRGAVAYVDGEPAGFIVVTHDSSGFMSAAIRKRWPYLGWLMSVSILRQPGRLSSVWEAWQIMRNLDSTPQDRMGEILSFGVLPAYRQVRFVRKTGIQVGLDLLNTAVKLLEDKRIKSLRSVVDDDNLEAKLFYRHAGWALSPNKVSGWKKPVVEFIWDFQEQ